MAPALRSRPNGPNSLRGPPAESQADPLTLAVMTDQDIGNWSQSPWLVPSFQKEAPFELVLPKGKMSYKPPERGNIEKFG